jgi:hypothetical protein
MLQEEFGIEPARETAVLGENFGKGSVLVHLCWPYIAQKQLRAAFEANREAEAVWRELGNLPKLIETYDMRQFLHLLTGEQKEVLAASSELLRLSRSIGNLMYQGNALATKANVHRKQGFLARRSPIFERPWLSAMKAEILSLSKLYY